MLCSCAVNFLMCSDDFEDGVVIKVLGAVLVDACVGAVFKFWLSADYYDNRR